MSACVLLLRHIDRIRPQATLEDVLYISSPKMIKRASLGFDGLMACIYWTRTVQYFGHRHFDARAHLQRTGSAAGDHDHARSASASGLPVRRQLSGPPPPNGAGEPERAIQLMEYGIEHNPDNWQLYYDLGFVYYTELKDYKKAAEVFRARLEGSQRSSLHEDHGRADGRARRRFRHRPHAVERHLRFEPANPTSGRMRSNICARFRWTKTSPTWNPRSHASESARDVFPPACRNSLLAEHLPGIPVDPDGNPYQLTLRGRVEVAKPGRFPFHHQGLASRIQASRRPSSTPSRSSFVHALTTTGAAHLVS